MWKDRALYARVSDPLVTAPPSAVVRFFVGKKENVVKSAIEPTARPRYRDPIECAASSIKSS